MGGASQALDSEHESEFLASSGTVEFTNIARFGSITDFLALFTDVSVGIISY